jgi:hypothetical protein
MSLFASQFRDVRGRERSRKERKKKAKIKKRTGAWRKKWAIKPGVYKEVHQPKVSKGRRQ